MLARLLAQIKRVQTRHFPHHIMAAAAAAETEAAPSSQRQRSATPATEDPPLHPTSRRVAHPHTFPAARILGVIRKLIRALSMP